ncbi:vesicle-associated protein 2-1 [Carica papaya]|uniref:vesicle-associated protein 2-1 n=1 Tax=Carica papaya TaxID=3649 RepID=UPI000B8C9886|nr:vesicle-associated protein 2-1 [Carica papaya]
MTAGAGNQLITVQPDELKFIFELEKQSYCDLKVITYRHHTVFNAVTLQAQREYPPDMQCKDKFLLQSTIVAPHTDVDELPQDTFNKDSGKTIEECKLKVAYVSPASTQASSEDEGSKNAALSPETNATIQRLKEERDAAVRQTQQLQQELDMARRQRHSTGDSSFSFKFAVAVGVIGIMFGFILNFLFPTPSTE